MVGIATSSFLDAQAGELVLRICGSTRRGQIVRLRSSKCTIGSGPQCTLRLKAPGVRPVHCLILRGQAATVIRRWAPDTRINGRTFTDAQLSFGDRIAVGPIELELLPPGCRCDADVVDDRDQPWLLERTEIENRLKVQAEELDARQAELESTREAFERERSRWEAEMARSNSASATELEELRARLSDLEAQRDQLREERDKRLAERNGAESRLKEQAEELDARRAELESSREAFERERGRWEAEMAESNSASATELEKLKARLSDLEAERDQLREERDKGLAERNGAESRLKEQTDELDARRAELESSREAFEREHSRWEAERTEAENRLNQRIKEIDDLDAREAQLQTEKQAVEERRREDGSEDDHLPEQEFEELSEGAPVDTLDVLRRMGAVSLLPKDEDEEEEPTKQQEAGRSTVPGICRPVPEQDQEESIDDYMAQLMERVRGITEDSSLSEPISRHTQPNDDTSLGSSEPSQSSGVRPPPAAGEPTSHGSPPQPTGPNRREPIELSPRAEAPEKSVDLSALRTLANFSARAAIDKHARGRLARTAYGKLLVSLVGFAIGGALIWMWWSLGAGLLTLYSGMLSVLVAVVWGMQYFVLTGVMVGGKLRQLTWESHQRSQASAMQQKAPRGARQGGDDGVDSAVADQLQQLGSETPGQPAAKGDATTSGNDA